MKSGRDRLVFAILLCFVQVNLLVCTNPSQGNTAPGYKYAFANAYAWKFRYPANYFTGASEHVFPSVVQDPSTAPVQLQGQQVLQPISQQLIPSSQGHLGTSQQFSSEPGQFSQQIFPSSQISIPSTQHQQQVVTTQQTTRPDSQVYPPIAQGHQQHLVTSQQPYLERGQIAQPTFTAGQTYTPSQQQIQQQLAQRYALLHQQLQRIKSLDNGNSNASPLLNEHGEQIGWQYYPVAGQHTQPMQRITNSMIQQHGGKKTQQQGNIPDQNMCPYGQHCSVESTQSPASASGGTYAIEQQEQDYNQILKMQQNLLQNLWSQLQGTQSMNAVGGAHLSGNSNGPVAYAIATMSDRHNGQPHFNTFTYTNA